MKSPSGMDLINETPEVMRTVLRNRVSNSKKMIFTGLGAVAELERNLIKERVHMGISRARKQGKQLGRPKRSFDREKAIAMAQSMSVRQVARKLGVSRGVIERALSRSDSSYR
jgi:DNA invertase Pin-like site-specific DNA recombinase